ncbi:MAG: hypothetical protein KatS3mg105_3248 [Gemmatales bacterium]|nr:MAG: hypothetical protein KatS3mg105_3248 [Gemmatales bacterium]
MRCCFLVVAAFCCFLPEVWGQDVLKSGPQPGTPDEPTFIPGSFQAWMVTGKHAGAFHSPIVEFGLSPVCLIFVKEVKLDPPLVELLQKIDKLAAKYPDARFRCCVLFLQDGGFRDFIDKTTERDVDVSEELADASRLKDELEKKTREIAKSAGLQQVVFGLAEPKKLTAYQLNDKASVTLLLYNKQRLLANYAFGGEFPKEAADKIGPEIEALVLEVDRLSRPQKRKKTR